MLNKNFLIKGSISTDVVKKEINQINTASMGAQSVFLGQVRPDNIEGKVVKEIEYSAYEEMVKIELEKIFSDISTKYDDLQKIIIIHSIGKVKAGEYSLFIFVGAGHRKNVFLALDDIVNQIKKRLPIWKKEVFEDTSYIWTENDKIMN
ncbi:MAG: molybdenum cofactor biosynthesis protein MoaE [Bacteroidales bacterium]|nr:molybdenum cofactor biosynthesis protein MoaE [Bacteroidales bacterium]MBN2758168.1 molybdenum cofactor biosynthesis protein MoaE [Bacteroidales bacterium]